MIPNKILRALKRRSSVFILTILTIFSLSSCSTSKKSEGNFISRGYQNIVARDNGYFNARESMKTNEETLHSQWVDDYDTLLPVFIYGGPEQSQSMQPAMDEIIKKASIVIELHGKSKWVDDCYFLIGKANFYKGDFQESLKAFQYVVAHYSDTPHKKKKHKKNHKEDDDLGFWDKFEQQPVSPEAQIWVARSLIAMEKYSDAQTVISVILAQEKFPQYLLGELYAVQADCYIHQQQNTHAIDALKLSIDNTDDKKTQARYSFILGQLYAAANDNGNAVESMKSVIALKPDYRMDFYAKLNLATLSMSEYGVSAKGTTANLEDLLKDEKYTEFYGLIYYVLADIQLAGNHKDEGLSDLNLSVRNCGQDTRQKSRSYMRLGDIYYADKDYENAYAFYDSCLAILPKDNTRHDEILSLHDGLKLLVEQLNIIKTEKQLQYWASLSDEDLEKELEKLFPQPEEEGTSEEAYNPSDNSGSSGGSSSGGGDFYFYNTSLRSRGFTEFKRVWGNRKLEDNWRRSDKSTFTESGEEVKGGETATADTSTINLHGKNVSIDDIRKSIPRTPEQIAASNAKIAAALFNVGTIYKEHFNEKVKATDAFRENVDNYPGNNFEPQSLYNLYLSYDGKPQADVYRDSLLAKYPESTFAKIIRDPDYLKKQDKKNDALDAYYTQTYALWSQGDYGSVLQRATAADTLFKPNTLKPKFEMLTALAFAGQDSVDLFKNMLQSIYAKYPSDDVGIKAKEILDFMQKEKGGGEEKTKPKGIYSFKTNEEHFFLYVMNSASKESVTLQNNLATFDATHFSNLNLKINSILLDKNSTMIIVKSFSDAASAMNYYHSILLDKDVLSDVNPNGITPMVISRTNYLQFYKAKDLDSYMNFFNENYLGSK